MPFDVYRQQPAGDQLAIEIAPFALIEFIADAVGAHLVVTEAGDAFILLAKQYIHQIADAEALAGAVDAGQRLLRGAGGIPGFGRLETGVAVTTGFGQLITEVA